MCGLSSIYLSIENLSNKLLVDYITKLLLLSQSRGREATGFALHDLDTNTVQIYKEPLSAKEFTKTPRFLKIFEASFANGVAFIGHNRLATNGSNAYLENNQPISNTRIACVQNGIVTNIDAVSALAKQKFVLDTYAILHLFDNALSSQNGDIKSALKDLYQKIEGENTIIFQLYAQNKLIHVTNCGTLYYIEDLKNNLFISASERYILEKFKNDLNIILPIHHLNPGQALVVDYTKKNSLLFNFNEISANSVGILRAPVTTINTPIIDLEEKFYSNITNLKRCTKCILPETFPGIKFNSKGVCNVCENYTKLTHKPTHDLEAILSKYRSKDGSPDCLVAFSGGRDSSYGLHLIKNKYKMNPVAYSYDWGMVTDLARRNQSRLCGKLGIEHIWVSADIKLKRENIRKNIEAWIKKPHIGMVPLFMVGDKTYFYHANRVMKNMGLNLIIFCPNNLERTNFKASYCGIKPSDFGKQVHHLQLIGKLKLLSFYATQYLTNPRYINSSIFDVVAGFLSYYVMNQDFLYLFDYETWDEQKIDALLKSEYEWEWDENYPSSWRIGDGTAPLYNMIYYMHAGFTENDCFRSNQIREGVINREEALQRVVQENKPRFKEVEEYCNLIHVDFVNLINAIREIRYEKK